jgi:4-hydroxy-3-polyprenylbenzoate decarboxylase
MEIGPNTSKRVFVAVTGASGSIYADRLVQCLRGKVERIYLCATDAGHKVVEHELPGTSVLRAILSGEISGSDRELFRVFKNDDLFAPIASGSSAPTHMIVAPCSMGTLARIAHGMSSNLVERAADVCLKQKSPLVLVPRETPLNAIHLRNMLTLAEMGAHMIPPVPGFYQKPKTIDDLVDFIVGRLLEAVGISDHGLYDPWNKRMR